VYLRDNIFVALANLYPARAVGRESHKHGKASEMNLLRDLLAGIAAIETPDSVLVAHLELKSNDEVVGVLPIELQKHYAFMLPERKALIALHKELSKQLEDLEDAGVEGDDERVSQIHQKFFVAESRVNDIYRLFWGAVRRTFPSHFEAENYGLRKDWQVVVNRKNGDECAGCATRESCSFGGMFREDAPERYLSALNSLATLRALLRD